jgi:hypothetical protein
MENKNQKPDKNQEEQQPLVNNPASHSEDKTKKISEDSKELANQPGSRRDNQDHKEDTIGIP